MSQRIEISSQPARPKLATPVPDQGSSKKTSSASRLEFRASAATSAATETAEAASSPRPRKTSSSKQRSGHSSTKPLRYLSDKDWKESLPATQTVTVGPASRPLSRRSPTSPVTRPVKGTSPGATEPAPTAPNGTHTARTTRASRSHPSAHAGGGVNFHLLKRPSGVAP